MSGPAAAANNRSGAGASALAPTAFKLLGLTLIGKGNLLGRAQIQMPSGMVITASVLRNRRDPERIFVLPVAERQQGGGYVNIVDFVSQELRESWQLAAFEAIKPRLADIMEGPPREEVGNGQF
ncbi:MAG: hypothetical protein KIS61_09290 [Candidatus Eremiobacteraeota bacterium]|nr:hypothetical protein [Candidatus Eremiobacteraeota bacterium]